uniref:Uncharacterized protein n=1 Tax=Haptolina brevifila TaxID=156173 RepID=A0A6U7FID1_9EUKA
MVVFYLGYCYSRHFEIYQIANQAKGAIVNVCAASRAYLPTTARRKLFVHLNLMHASAYCALTPIYTYDNFLSIFSKLHHIEIPDHHAYFGDVDTAGGTHYNTCAVWAMGVLQKAATDGELHPEAFRSMHEEILRARSLFSTIFAFQYQVSTRKYQEVTGSDRK